MQEKIRFVAKVEWTMFGSRYFYKVIKRCKNTPGFAPEEFDCLVGDLVISYSDHTPCLLTDNTSMRLYAEDFKVIAKQLKRGFIKKDFKKVVKELEVNSKRKLPENDRYYQKAKT